MSFYFYPFVAICLVLIGTAVIRPRLIYEYPYFMAVAFTVFILPQAYSLYQNEWGGIYLQTTLVMCSLCVASCWIGYQGHPHPKLLEKFNVAIDPGRFFIGGIILICVGCFFLYKAATLPEADRAGEVTGMTGIGTIYLFFGDLVYPGFAICFYCAVKERWALAWVASAIAALFPISRAVYQGRREPTALFIITLGLTLYFVKNVKPPRIIVVGMLVGTAMILPATGDYRALASEDPLKALEEIDFAQKFQDSLEEDSISELKDGTALIAATQATGDYQFGADYWNALVFRFVPAQFVGKELKESLMVGGVQRDFSGYVERVLGFPLPMGMTITGMGDSFNQFGYFGCLFFAALGYLFKSMWAAANSPNGVVAQILYIQVTTSAMRAVTHESIDFLPGFIYSAIFIGMIAWFSRQRSIAQPIISGLSPGNSLPALPP